MDNLEEKHRFLERYSLSRLNKEEGIENPLDKLCDEFCNFPEDSIRQIICSENEILKFEW